ncbi:MAG: hypothetical protein JEZ07_04010 [Phycisphaerae bacterium]|nr:hypothetical protein [Phycisphaerae bacterium]
MKFKKNLFLIAILALSVMCNAIFAQTTAVDQITARISGQPVFLLGFEGLETVEPALKTTTMYKLIEDPATQKFIEQVKAELLNNKEIKNEIGEVDMEQVQQVLMMAKSVANCPMVFGLLANKTNKDIPITAFAVIDGGENKDKLMPLYSMLEAQVKNDCRMLKINGFDMYAAPKKEKEKVYFGWMDNYFVFVFGEDTGSTVKNLTKAKVNKKPVYLKNLTKTQGGTGVITFYADAPKIGRIIEDIMELEGEDEARQIFEIAKAVIDKLGLGEITTLTSRVSIKDGDFIDETKLAIPQPYTGLMAASRPIDTAMLQMVDQSVYSVSVSNTNITAMIDTIMNTAQQLAPPEAFQQIQDGIGMAEQQLGVKFRDGLLKSFAGPSVMYMIPPGTMPESPAGGGVMICELTSAKLFQDNFIPLENLLQTQFKELSNGMFQISQQSYDKYQVRSWNIGPAAMFGLNPSWTVHDKYLVFGTNDAMCRSAIDFLKQPVAKRQSILNNARFKAATADMPKNLLSFSYTDTEKEFIAMSTNIRQFWGMFSGIIGMQAGITIPQLPNLNHHAKDMKPAVSYCWSEKDGIYTYQRGSSSSASMGAGGIAAGALGVSILMPALSKARTTAKATVCMSNLRQIGVATVMYTQDNDDKSPDSLASLKPYLGEDFFNREICPSSPHTQPYHYYGKGVNSSASASIIIAFDKYDNHPEMGRNVLFADTHVKRFRNEAEFKQAVEENNKLRKQAKLPVIKITDGPSVNSSKKTDTF